MTPTELRICRKKLGLNTDEFGIWLGGYSGRSVRRWESGETPIPGAVVKCLELAKEYRYLVCGTMAYEGSYLCKAYADRDEAVKKAQLLASESIMDEWFWVADLSILDSDWGDGTGAHVIFNTQWELKKESICLE